MNPSRFTYQSTSRGYTIFYDGKPLGGVGTMPTHGARRRNGHSKSADLIMFARQGKQICAELKAGAGPAYLRSAMVG